MTALVQPVVPPGCRLQVRGDFFHGQVPFGAVYVGRSAPGLQRSVFHNPYQVGARLLNGLGFGYEDRVVDARHAVELFAEYARRQGRAFEQRVVRELAGWDVACWCPLPAEPGLPDWCHGAVLLRIAAGERRWLP